MLCCSFKFESYDILFIVYRVRGHPVQNSVSEKDRRVGIRRHLDYYIPAYYRFRSAYDLERLQAVHSVLDDAAVSNDGFGLAHIVFSREETAGGELLSLMQGQQGLGAACVEYHVGRKAIDLDRDILDATLSGKRDFDGVIQSLEAR